MTRHLAVWALVIVAAAACTTAGAVSSPSPIATSSATSSAGRPVSPSPSAHVVLPGTLVIADVPPDQIYVFADGGVLYEVEFPSTPPPYASRVRRFDPSTRTWTDVFNDDAMFTVGGTSRGRAAMIEYREPLQGGGASHSTVVALDLNTGVTTELDHFALSAATFRGGGGGPIRPVSRVMMGGNTIAWTRLNELPGGDIEGELRVEELGRPGAYMTVARSRSWIEPLMVDDAVLVYHVTGTKFDELHVRDLRTGEDRRLVQFAIPDPSMGRSGLARSGMLIGWIDAAGNAALQTIDLMTGERAVHDIGADYCVGLSGNELGFAWECPSKAIPTSLSYWDPLAKRDIQIVTAAERPNTLQAVPGGFTWYDLARGVRRVNLLTVAR